MCGCILYDMYNLEHLYKKPIPHTKRVWQVGVNTEKRAIPIVDKRDDAKVDRKMIMERIREKPSIQAIAEKELGRDFESVARDALVPIAVDESKAEPEKAEEKQAEEKVPETETAEKKAEEKVPEPEKAEEKKAAEENVPEPENAEEKVPEPEKAEEKKAEEKVPEPEKKKRGKIVIKGKREQVISNVDDMVINGIRIGDRKPKPSEKYIYNASSYYMNNRLIYSEKINSLFKPYQAELAENAETESCDSKSSEEIKLLTHQKVVRDYLNLYTPYRGLLILHALGSGKTCTSIAIAEGLKSDKRVYIMTPASLKMNYFSELKRCGDHLFRKNQYWEFVSTAGLPDMVDTLSAALSITKEFITKNGGAWLVDVSKPANFTKLPTDDQSVIDEQLNEMIRSKYKDINYNGLNKRIMNELTKDSTVNPFDGSVVVIDEAHNFVSRVVNKIKTKEADSISSRLYEYLMKATDVRVVMLTGTPIINYPNEIGILYNILRGYIKTWTFTVRVMTSNKINRDAILSMFDKAHFNTYDFVEYSGNKLTITRNPFGFVNTKKHGNVKADTEFEKYNGVKLDATGNISDADFEKTIIGILKKNELEVLEGATAIRLNKALPDDSDAFLTMFVDPDSVEMKNEQLFERRILGLTSYFPSSNDKLLPSFVRTAEGDKIHIVKSEMSDYQFSAYEKIRKEEADREKAARKRKGKGDDLYQASSSYRVRSRTCCNFAFPDPPGRPLPDKGDYSETDIDGVSLKDLNDDDTEGVAEQPADYAQRIQLALKYLKDNSDSYFTPESIVKYSPKFANILENVTDKDNAGLHLIYSQFYTIEGIGILKLMLEANGFSQLRISKKSGDVWEVENPEDDKPKFLLYTGSESVEEKEILRNIYNSQWDFVPASIANELKRRAPNNFMGDVVKIMMITASGAEGINLKNTRFVHIVEPYWHMVRIDQVIGRARRICSHQDLPEELRTVKVFLYLATLSEKQKTNEDNKELIIRDVSKLNKNLPITTDETLFENSQIKDNINQQILRCVKQSSIDCSLYKKVGKEHLICYGHDKSKIKSNDFSSHPEIDIDQHMKPEINLVEKKIKLYKLTMNKVDYAYDRETNLIYDMASYKGPGAQLVELGKLVENDGKKTIEFNDK